MPHRRTTPLVPPLPHVTRAPTLAVRPLIQAVHLALAASLLSNAPMAHAQTDNPAATQTDKAAADELHTYDIPAGPLSTVLPRFAAKAGIFLVGAAELTQNKQSPGVQGRMKVQAALDQLLAGSGLSWTFSGPNTVTISQHISTNAEEKREANSRPVSESGAPTLTPIVVYGKSEGLDRDLLDRVPNKSKSIEGALDLFSQVQTSTSAERSLQGGEIKPPQISISGSKPYESRYVINGLGNNNYVAPPAVGTGSITSSTVDKPGYNEGFGNSPSGVNSVNVNTLPLGMVQNYNLNPELLDNIKLYDSRVPVNHGGFTGGVVSADTRKPDPSRVSGKIYWGHSRSDWDKMFYDPAGLRGLDYKRSFAADIQPEYSRNTSGIMLNVPLNDNFAAIVAYDLTRTHIPLLYQSRSSANNALTATTKDQIRSAETFFTSIGGQTESGLNVNLTGVYYQYKGSYFSNQAINSGFEQKQDTYDLALNLSKILPAGKASARFKYGNMVSSREIDSDTAYQWNNYGDNNWGNPNGINSGYNATNGLMQATQGYSVDGLTSALGDFDFKQRTLQAALEFEFNELEWGATRHRFAVGTNSETVLGEAASSGYTAYNSLNYLAINGPLAPGQDGVTYNYERTGGALYDQYQFQKVIGAPFERSARTQTRSLWLQDTIMFSDFMLRPGVRVDYDDQYRNLNIAPRIASSWNILGKNVAVLHAGQARYYGGPNLYYSLFRLGDSQTYRRGNANSVDANGMLTWTRTAALDDIGLAFAADDMKTPYTDESSMGLDLNLRAGFAVNYNFVYREGKDGIMRKAFRNDQGKTSYAATNDGESSYTGHTILISNNWFKNHYFSLGTTFSKTKSSYIDYLTDSDSYLDATTKTDRTRVIYNGTLMDRNELDVSQFGRPQKFVGLWRAQLPWQADLTTTVTYTKKSSILVASSPAKTLLDDGWNVYSYTKGELPSSFVVNMSLGVDLYHHNTQTLRATLDVYNVMNNKIQNGIGTFTSGGKTNYFDYYAPGRSIQARLEYSF